MDLKVEIHSLLKHTTSSWRHTSLSTSLPTAICNSWGMRKNILWGFFSCYSMTNPCKKRKLQTDKAQCTDISGMNAIDCLNYYSSQETEKEEEQRMKYKIKCE